MHRQQTGALITPCKVQNIDSWYKILSDSRDICAHLISYNRQYHLWPSQVLYIRTSVKVEHLKKFWVWTRRSKGDIQNAKYTAPFWPRPAGRVGITFPISNLWSLSVGLLFLSHISSYSTISTPALTTRSPAPSLLKSRAEPTQLGLAASTAQPNQTWEKSDMFSLYESSQCGMVTSPVKICHRSIWEVTILVLSSKWSWRKSKSALLLLLAWW